MHLEQSWKCPCCGETMTGLANSFACNHPDNWTLPTKIDEKSTLTSELCRIFFTEGDAEYYIRCTMEFPIIGSSEKFMFGLWASVSERSYQIYKTGMKANDYNEEGCFAYLGNNFPCVDGTFGLHTDLYFPEDDNRPTLSLQSSDHVLVEIQEFGISEALLIEINGLFTRH